MKSTRSNKEPELGMIIPGRLFTIPVIDPLRTKLYPVTRRTGASSDFPSISALLAGHKRKEELIAWVAEMRWRAANRAWPVTKRDLMDVLWLHRGEGSIDYRLAVVIKRILWDETVKTRTRWPACMPAVAGPVVTGEVSDVHGYLNEAPALALFIDKMRIGKHAAVMHRMQREQWYADRCRRKPGRDYREKLDKKGRIFKV